MPDVNLELTGCSSVELAPMGNATFIYLDWLCGWSEPCFNIRLVTIHLFD